MTEAKTEKSTFAAGCFWGVEDTFRHLSGVLETIVGYTGGHFENPTYHDVCSGNTGHAEAVQIIFDPLKISYEELLSVFWKCHDPISKNRQGNDIGFQYRSAIFTHTPEQQTLAEASKRRLQASIESQGIIVTEIFPITTFYRAEEYHQQYYEKHGGGSCAGINK
jgi:peptide-methionine (S)-S-oxide reductase